MMGPDAEMTRNEIAKFSKRDAERYPQYEAMLEGVAAVVEPTLTMAPPDLRKPRLGDLRTLLTLRRSFRQLGDATGEAVEILTGAARPILDRWFESEELKGTLATDAIIGAMASPSMPGTAYVLFHHVMGEAGGTRGVWAYMRGGMGGITQALAAAARDLGADIRCEAEVARILLRDGRVDYEGEFHRAKNLELRPRGPRPGAIPIMLGAHGKRTMRLAVEHADIWSCYATESGRFRWTRTVGGTSSRFISTCPAWIPPPSS